MRLSQTKHVNQSINQSTSLNKTTTNTTGRRTGLLYTLLPIPKKTSKAQRCTSEQENKLTEYGTAQEYSYLTWGSHGIFAPLFSFSLFETGPHTKPRLARNSLCRARGYDALSKDAGKRLHLRLSQLGMLM